jgi:diguanylate cyclase (GGDEF)-like protein/PAS domain S-box-containing protein
MFRNQAQRIVLTGIALVVGLLVAAGSIGVWGLRSIESQLTRGLQTHYQHSSLADEMQDASLQRLLVLQAMAATPDPFARNELLGQLQLHAGRFMAAREQLGALALRAPEQALLQRQAEAANKAAPLVQRVAELLLQGEDAQATRLLLDEVIPAQGNLMATLQQLIAEEARQIDIQTRVAQQRSQQAVQELLLLAGLGIVMAVLIAWYSYRQIGRILAMLHGLVGRLRRTTRRERAIRRTMLDGLITADSQGRILTANRAAEQLLGYEPGELLGQNLSIIMPSRDAAQHDHYVRRYLGGDQPRIIGKGREVEAKHKDGRLIPVELGVAHLRQDGEDRFVGFLHDIRDRKENERLLKEAKAHLATEVMMRTAELETANRRLAQEVAERKQAQQLLARQATIDALTGLANRRLFHERLEEAVAGARRHDSGLAVMYLDLDGFKQVNDSHGHHTGDQLLQWVARRLRQVLRREDLLARLGGDEFAVLLEHVTDPTQLDGIATKLVTAIGAPVSFGDIQVQVGASVGIAQFASELDADTLLRHADAAMYRAKHAGRGRHHLYQAPQPSRSTG